MNGIAPELLALYLTSAVSTSPTTLSCNISSSLSSSENSSVADYRHAILNEQRRCGGPAAHNYFGTSSRSSSELEELMRYSPFSASSYTRTESSIDIDPRPLVWTRKPWKEVQQMQYTQGPIRREIAALKEHERRKQEMDYFAELPIEMLYYILQYLVVHEVELMASFCKYFRTVVHDLEADVALWKQVYNTQFGVHGSTIGYNTYCHKPQPPDKVANEAHMWHKICLREAKQMSWRRNDTTQLLYWAAEHGHWRILRRARLTESLTMTEINKLMVLAAGEGHVECVDILSDVLLLAGYGLEGNMNGTGTNRQRRRGYTAILKAALRGHADVVALLVDKGADVNAKDHWGETSVLKAARGGASKVVETLLSQTMMPCDIHATNSDGDDALMAAAKAGHAKCTEVLLSHGARATPQHATVLALLKQVQL